MNHRIFTDQTFFRIYVFWEAASATQYIQNTRIKFV